MHCMALINWNNQTPFVLFFAVRIQVLMCTSGMQLVVVWLCVACCLQRIILHTVWVNEYDDSGDRKSFLFLYVLCKTAFSSSKFAHFFQEKMSRAVLASRLRRFGNAAFTKPKAHHSRWPHNRPHRSFSLLLSLFSVKHICPLLAAGGTHFTIDHVFIIRSSQGYTKVFQQSPFGFVFCCDNTPELCGNVYLAPYDPGSVFPGA